MSGKTGPAGPLERLLGLTSGLGEPRVGPRLDAFVQVFVIHVAVRDWVRVIERVQTWRVLGAAVLTLCAVAAFSRRHRPLAVHGVLGVLAVKLAIQFPLNSNHFMIELLCASFIVVAYKPDEGRRGVLLASLRWMPAVVLLWSGLQKLSYGTYLDGSYMAYMASRPNHFQAFFSWFVPADEIRALAASGPLGPFRFRSMLPVLVANAVYTGELVVGALLLVPRARVWGFVGGLGILLAIEVVARELMFGLLMLNLLLLYRPLVRPQRLLAPFGAAYALLVVLELVAPGAFN